MTRKDRVRRHAMAVAHTRREDNRTGAVLNPQPPLVEPRNGPALAKPTRRKVRRLLTRASRRDNR